VQRNRHPDHDRLAAEVRGWYTVADPRGGYQVERRPYGFYGRALREHVNRVTIAGLAVSNVEPFLADLREYFSGGPVRIVVDDAALDRQIGGTLIAGGCVADHSLVYLAHVGEVPTPPAVHGLSVETVVEQTLRDFVTVRIKGFADSEAEPPAAQVDDEIVRRRDAIAAGAHFFLARIDGVPAAVAGWRDGPVRFVFQLATRLPFRGRGIATALLCGLLADAYARGCASVVINTDPAGLAIRLYRRLGFVDEVYRQQRYDFNT
jgi:ribosomal protein S18 acetylase RimI-like enzyme